MAGFSDIYRQYEPKVYGFLLSLSRDPVLAEELTQETFYRAFLHIDRYEERCELLTWLCQIGKNAYFKEFRRQKRFDRQKELPVDPDAGTGQNPAELYAKKEELQRLRRHLEQLPEPYREVLTLRTYGELSYREIGALYGRTETWARVTCYRAKEKLMGELMKEEKNDT